MKKFAEELRTMEIKTTFSIKKKVATINQTQRNEIKKLFENALKNDFKDINLVVGITSEGVGVEFFNEELGAIPIVSGGKFKNLNYDVIDESELFEKEQMKKQIEKEKRDKDKKFAYAENERIKEERKKKVEEGK